MDALATPTAAPPVLYGAPAPPGDLLPWSWAEQRLVAARTYWIATTRPDGRPHCRPVWGVWLADGFWFSTGSLARHNLAANPQITVHLESGDQVVIVEGVAAAVTGQRGCRGSWPPTTPSTTGTRPPPTTKSPTRRGGWAGLPGAAAGRLRLGRRHACADPLVLRRRHHDSDPIALGPHSNAGRRPTDRHQGSRSVRRIEHGS
jgi:Pyridoxamine 5'-phosphate oxidase